MRRVLSEDGGLSQAFLLVSKQDNDTLFNCHHKQCPISLIFFLPIIRMEHLINKTAVQNFRDLPKRTNVSCGGSCVLPFLGELSRMIHGYESPMTAVTLGL